MKNEVLNSIREQINRLKRERDYYQGILSKISELKKNCYVQEYLELTSMVKGIDVHKGLLSDDELIDISFQGNVCNIVETNDVYFCFDNVRLTRKNCDIMCRRYMNIENPAYSYLIPFHECEQFEKEHRVISDRVSFEDVKYAIRKFREVQFIFLKEAMIHGQEKAIEKVLKKN